MKNKSAPALTAADIIKIQISQIAYSDEEGDKGTEGLVLYMGTLEYIEMALDMPDIKNNPIRSAALVLYTITTGHPFYQGNKRTAFEAADMLLGLHDMYISVKPVELLNFMKDLAMDRYDMEDVEKWIKCHINKV